MHTGDLFKHWTDENGEHLKHEPAYGTDRGDVILVYAIIRTRDDGVYIEVMDRPAIEKVRNVSRTKDSGPWGSWWDEMARKTVLRRLAKRAPMSTDVAELLQRDDDQFDFSRETGEVLRQGPAPTRPRALAAIAGEPAMDAAIVEDRAPAAAQADSGSVF